VVVESKLDHKITDAKIVINGRLYELGELTPGKTGSR